MLQIFISLFLSFVMPVVLLTDWAEAKEFRIDVYDASKTEKGYPPNLSKLKFIRSIHVNSISNQYFIHATSEDQRSPQTPYLDNPSFRCELLKSSSETSRFRKKKSKKLLSRHVNNTPPPRRVVISGTDSHRFSVNTTWSQNRTSHSETTVDPLLMITLLLEVEDCMGRRDVRYNPLQEQWEIKNDDAHVLPGLSGALDCTREQWDRAFYDGILGVDEDWSIYAVVMSSERNIWWNGVNSSHQVVIGFQLINVRSGANLFIQITNWTNDNQHQSYDYCNAATSTDCPLLTEPETQAGGEEPWTPHRIFITTGIYSPTENTTDSLLSAVNEGFEHNDGDNDHDAPNPSGATGYSGSMSWPDK